jgi:hypothetical protein
MALESSASTPTCLSLFICVFIKPIEAALSWFLLLRLTFPEAYSAAEGDSEASPAVGLHYSQAAGSGCSREDGWHYWQEDGWHYSQAAGSRCSLADGSRYWWVAGSD